MTRSSRAQLIGLAVTMAVVACACPNALAAKKATDQRDRHFANNGWSYPSDGKHKYEDSSGIEVDRRGNVFVLVTTANSNGTPNGGFIQKLSPRGRLVRGFGRRGIVKFHGKRVPVDMSIDASGRVLLMSEIYGRHDGAKLWTLSRLTAGGTRDSAFGSTGQIGFAPREDVNYEPIFQPLPSGRVAVAHPVQLSDKSYEERLYIYDSAGKLDASFDQDGVKPLDFNVNSIAEIDGRGIALTGSSAFVPHGNNNIVIAKLLSDGGGNSAWGVDGKLLIRDIPTSVFKSFMDQKGNSDPVPPATYHRGVYGAVMPDGSIQLVIDSNLSDVPDVNYAGMAWTTRLRPDGTVATNYGHKGTLFIADLYLSDEPGAYSDWDFQPFADGRTLRTEFSGDSEDDQYTDYWVSILGANGSSKSRDAKKFSFPNLGISADGFDNAGKYMYMTVYPGKRLALMRVRIR